MKDIVKYFFLCASIVLFVITTYYWIIGGFNIAGRGNIKQLDNMHIIFPMIFLVSTMFFLGEISINKEKDGK